MLLTKAKILFNRRMPPIYNLIKSCSSKTVETLCSDEEMILMTEARFRKNCQSNWAQVLFHCTRIRHNWFERRHNRATSYKAKLVQFKYIPNLLRLDYAHSCKLVALLRQKKCPIHVILFVHLEIPTVFTINMIQRSKVTNVVKCWTTFV